MNWKAVIATVLGCSLAWGGVTLLWLADHGLPGLRSLGLLLRPLYDYAWFVGFGVAFVTYVPLMRWLPHVPGAIPEASPRP